MNDIIDYKKIGKNIRIARLKKEITQEQLANKLDIAPTYISAIERGASKASFSTFVMIAQELGTTLDCILGDIQPAFMEKYDIDAKEILADCTEEERTFLLSLLSHAKEDLRTKYRTK
ncbi:MAG: helix-turn-helix domain-containing protein [Eubacterium sp.]|nr:helix-turn-helix domain-containing protein [Eubacterium sp.]